MSAASIPLCDLSYWRRSTGSKPPVEPAVCSSFRSRPLRPCRVLLTRGARVHLFPTPPFPRWPFESERKKERSLNAGGGDINPGSRFFTPTTRRYPTTLDELEKLGDKRFLRRRYKDPIT